MYVGLSEEQEEFSRACRRLLERNCPTSLVRELASSGDGHSEALFTSLASLGLFELAVPAGDEPGGFIELGIAYREAGRALVPTTLYSTVWAALLLRGGAPESPLLPQIRQGRLVATVAQAEEGVVSLESTTRYKTTAGRLWDGGWIISGTKLFVQNAGAADVLLVVAKVVEDGSDDRIVLLAVPRQIRGLVATPMMTFGHDRQAEVTFDKVQVDAEAVVAGPFSHVEWLSWFGSVNDRATALQCMEMLGGAERVLDDTVAYIKEREVFGRPIGTFQAAQHHVANLGIAVAAARVAAYQALCAADSDRDARRTVSTAKSWLSKAYKEVTVLAHQLFGAIGYVRETDLHLWSQRAKTTEALFGDRSFHLGRLADLTFGPVSDG
jgi:3-oxocholest-4-en-26-oyl-CoA dehydrogenase beta subunit